LKVLPKIDATIPCDSEKLEVVFVNLIMNAIQAIGNKIKVALLGTIFNFKVI